MNIPYYFEIDFEKIKSNTDVSHFLALMQETPIPYRNGYKFVESGGLILHRNSRNKYVLQNFSGKTGYLNSSDILNVIAYKHSLNLSNRNDLLACCSIFAELTSQDLGYYNKNNNTTYPIKYTSYTIEDVKNIEIPFLPNQSHEVNTLWNCKLATKEDKNLWDSFIHYWKQYGIDEEYLNLYKVLPLKYVSLSKENTPTVVENKYTYFNEKDIAFTFIAGKNVKIKRVSAISSSTSYARNSGNYVFGYDQLPDSCNFILICAGEKDCLILNKYLNKYDIYCICFNSESAKIRTSFLQSLKTKTDAIGILYDDDVTGNKFSDRNILEHSELIYFSISSIKKQYNLAKEIKDVGDLKSNNRITELINYILEVCRIS